MRPMRPTTRSRWPSRRSRSTGWTSFIPYSVEVGGDWPGMEQDLAMVMQDARDRLEATAHAKGTGTGQPAGIETELDGTASEIAPDTAETFAVSDVYNLQRQLPPRYRGNASWVMNIGTANTIRQFDTGGGGNFWTDLPDSTPGRLLGWQATDEGTEFDDSPDIDAAATEDNFVLFVGDWSRYVIVDRVGMAIEAIPHLFGSNQRPRVSVACTAGCGPGPSRWTTTPSGCCRSRPRPEFGRAAPNARPGLGVRPGLGGGACRSDRLAQR